MLFKFSTCNVLVVLMCFWYAFPAQSQALKRKAGFNLNWKFIAGNPANAQQPGTSDATWQNVNVPHSASYDAPNYTAETAFYQGNCWYRKTFTVPASAKKVFIEFEGAMQTATVYVNGTQAGAHDNSGYTPFYYDISNKIVRGASNVMAVMLNNQKSADIPPGGTGSAPDFYLYSGIYRSVWLHFKDSVYVPVYSQHIQTVNVSASSAQIRAVTPVKNDSRSAQNVTVAVTLFNAAHASVATQSSTLSIPAATLDTIDLTTSPFTPALWSPSSPTMYSAQTLVSMGGVVVDSVVEPCGIRWITWNAAQGMYLNGSRLEIRGMCVHQFEGWIENAVPDSRYWQEVKQLKNLGCNSVRCSHYPRARAFYDACDRQGMLVYVEQPSWGWGMTPTAACWARMDSCVKEMVMAGRNHPCIYMRGLYKETKTGDNFTTNMTTLNNTAHRFDSTRFTATANIQPFNGAVTVPDVEGLNYTTTGSSVSRRWINTESSDDFYRLQVRGSSVDLDTSATSYYQREWTCMNYTMNTTGQLAGGHFWCFKDYNSGANTNGNEGIVDRLTLPKTVFYKFRKMWTGQAMDFPVAGTATKIEFVSDTSSLSATGSDVFLLTATLRDDAGRQISTATGNVTFSVSPAGSGTIFGGASSAAVPAQAGRAGAMLRTTTTPSTMTVTAAYTGLSTATLTLTTSPVSESYIEGSVGVAPRTTSGNRPGAFALRVVSTVKGYAFSCPLQTGCLSVIDCRGKTLYSMRVAKGVQPVIGRGTMGAGLYYAVWDNGGQRLMTRVNALN